MTQTRRLAAILAADVAGYSRLMGADEERTHERLKQHLRELVDPKIKEHRGRTVKNTGDGLLAEFSSVVDAVRCAVEIQRGMIDREPEMPDEQRIRFRIGINLGDVIVEEHDIFGDGVNVAARLEALAEPGGICVSRVVRDQVRDKLPCPFEDMGDQQVKNIARPVRVFRVGEFSVAKSTSAPALPLPDKPSIAVLPFQNMSSDPEQEYFVDGMVEEIITALSRIRWLFVIACNSSFTYKGQSVDVKRVGRELGVRYVLEGSVRKGGNRVRITAQLVEAETGAYLWADRFDGSLEDVFELQDDVAISVAGVIEPALQAAEVRRSARRPTSDLTAYDLLLRARAAFSTRSKAGITRALDFSEQAIGRDPHYGSALGFAGSCRVFMDVNGWTEELGQNRRAAIGCAERALESAGDDPVTLVYAAHALAYFGENIDAVIALVDRALALNPSFARGWLLSAQIRIWAGQLDLALEHAGRAMRLIPRHLPGTHSFVVGLAHFLSRRFEDAMPKLIAAVQHVPNAPEYHRALASCYAHMGRLEEARSVIERLRTISPVVAPELNQFRNPEHRELFLSGLRLAAGEAT
jgi:TolB-like protein/tetratricopeptide (TPR) repeat protein